MDSANFEGVNDNFLEAEVAVELGETDDWDLVYVPSRVWARLYDDHLSLHETRDDTPLLVVPMLMARSIEVIDECTLCLASEYERYELVFDDAVVASDWHASLHRFLASRRDLPFGAAAPPRPCTPTTFFVDGEAYFGALAETLGEARSSILIADWCLTPEILMKRPADDAARLDHILAARVAAGVEVYVLLYGESGLELGSERTARQLEALGAHVVRHSPSWKDIYYSHHQKLVVVDEQTAFVGGLDLTFGRWDRPDHPVCGESALFPGVDYYNPEVREPNNADLANPAIDVVDRAKLPRWPWHDVQCKVEGEAARDIAVAFLQRWNQHHFEQVGTLPRPIRLQPSCASEGAMALPTVQVVRSQAQWNGGAYAETSIYQAWLDTIARAERYLYIEQQFFISSLAGPPVENEIARQLLERVSRAIDDGARFEVIVVLPAQPTGSVETSISTRAIMHWQYRTIDRGGMSLLEQLRTRHPRAPLDRYIGFFSLRGHGILNNHAVTAPVYVHSKLVIADDQTVVIGSANINDRSMSGARDSEIGVHVRDGGHDGVARDLRCRLFEHLLGEPLDIRQGFLDAWQRRADVNTALYQAVFPWLPHPSLRSTEALRAAVTAPIDPSRLNAVRGFVVHYPLGFLTDEWLAPTAWDLERYLGDDIYV